ncbi:amino acid ABC transporter substrate-binding protein [Noviherbaspirillum massiliense]|uniref:amino acid ABC transporter substrate-binding protein n=1 Tax=Noviherbaspirillum massiliense TaxID=1465823 RepID=UPI00030F394D|nr:amino acid ABC transporter substrate-binding protein [Noviherbaspirillum massiliense]
MKSLVACGSLATTIVAALVTVLPASAQAEDTLSKIRDTKTVTIAYQETSVPFSFMDENKKPAGYAIDLCLKVVDAIQKELKLPQLNVAYVPINSSNRIAAIVEGRADLECGTTTNTPERRKQVAFTIPHFIASARLMVKADSPIKNWNDLRNKTIVITKGAVQYGVVKERNESSALNMTFVEGKNHGDSFKILEAGQADAYAMGDVVLYGLRAQAKDPSAFNIVGDPLSAEPYAIMFRKEDPAFKAVVDREVARVMNAGELNKLYDKWFKTPVPALNNVALNMPMSFLLRDSIRFPSDKVAQ